MHGTNSDACITILLQRYQRGIKDVNLGVSLILELCKNLYNDHRFLLSTTTSEDGNSWKNDIEKHKL